MNDSLKNLIQAESEAEDIVSRGEYERDAIVQKSIDDAADMEQQFKHRLPEIHQSFLNKARESAEQSIAEIKLRYDERSDEMRALATKHEQEALQYAIELILTPGKPE